jgi:hypothetical protein
MPRNAPRGAPSYDKGEAAFWKGLKPGDFIGLSDAESYAAALAAGPAAKGGSSEDFRVGEIREFRLLGPETGRASFAAASCRGGGSTYRFAELRKGETLLYLALIEADALFEPRLYFIPAGIEGGTRDDFIDRGDTWLFLPPRDSEDFLSSELEYAPYPDVPEIEELDPDSGRELRRKLVFSRVGPAALYGEALDTGAPVIIAEYEAEAPPGEAAPANPLLLVLEEGWMRRDGSEPEEGGYLTVMLGKPLSPGEIELYPA